MPDAPNTTEAEREDWEYQHFAYWYAAAYNARRRRAGWPFHNKPPF